jgi:nitrate reductase NapD
MDIGVCGVLVHTKPAEITPVRDALERLPGVEVHAATREGRMVVTVEDTGEAPVFETITGFHHIKGVISTSLIYGHSEKYEPEQESE